MSQLQQFWDIVELILKPSLKISKTDIGYIVRTPNINRKYLLEQAEDLFHLYSNDVSERGISLEDGTTWLDAEISSAFDYNLEWLKTSFSWFEDVYYSGKTYLVPYDDYPISLIDAPEYILTNKVYSACRAGDILLNIYKLGDFSSYQYYN